MGSEMCIRDRADAADGDPEAERHASDGEDEAFGEQLADELGTGCLLYTSDAADERSSGDLGGRRIIKKKKTNTYSTLHRRL